MKRSRIEWFWVLAVALTLGAGSAQGQDIRSKADQYMQASLKIDHFMGSVLIAQHGKILFDKGYGMANLELNIPNTPETKFRIGSNTKQFIALAIMELQERGKLNVQDSVCKYVPDCPADWQAIKIFNLLTHTPGIPNFTSFLDYEKRKTLPTTVPALLARFENKPLEFKPGEKFSYSNSGYEVLGFIIQKASGESYQDFLQKNIFDPLGLKDTGYDSNSRIVPNRAEGYVYRNGTFLNAAYIDMSIPFSAGGLYSTVLDLYKWDRSLQAGTLVSRKSLDEMFTPYKGDYGFGWFISKKSGRRMISHEGGINGFTSYNSWFPDEDADVVVLDNDTSPEVGKVSRALAAMLFGGKYELPQEHYEISLPADVLNKYIGEYQLAPNFIITVTRSGAQLYEQATAQPKFPIFAESKTQFFLKVVDAQITFVEDARGQVTQMVLQQGGRDIAGKKIR